MILTGIEMYRMTDIVAVSIEKKVFGQTSLEKPTLIILLKVPFKMSHFE